MTTMVSQITSIMVVYSTVYSDADQRKHQSSGPVNSPHKGPVARKMLSFDDVIMETCTPWHESYALKTDVMLPTSLSLWAREGVVFANLPRLTWRQYWHWQLSGFSDDNFLVWLSWKTKHENIPARSFFSQICTLIYRPQNVGYSFASMPWWRHQMETFSALLVLCAENLPTTGELPAQRPGTRSFDVSLWSAPE